MTGPAERYLASFPAGQVREFPVRGLDPVDVALHSAALPASAAHPGGSGLGYGPTPAAARVGALGEMAEMALSTRALAGRERVEGSYAELVRTRGAHRVQDPRTLCLEAGSAYADDLPLRWLPARRLRDDAPVWVPVELLASRPVDVAHVPGPRLTTVITNGLGAGLDPDRALSHGELRAYRSVIEHLEFGTVFTPFEGATGITTDHVVHLVDRLLSGPPDAGPVPLEELA